MNRDTKSDYLFLAVVYTVITFALIVVLFPLIFVVAASFSDPSAVNQGKVFLWPVDITIEGYERIFKNNEIHRVFIWSTLI